MAIHPESSPIQIVNWLQSKYPSNQVVLTTSFGLEGCALIDMCAQANFRVTIANIDTGFLFKETKALHDKMIRQYANLDFVTWKPEQTPAEQAETHGESLWQSNPRQCCLLRKVRPLEANIHSYQVWMTAIRKSQSETRSHTELIQWDWSYRLLKICPLARWSREDVWNYIQEHDVPHNALHQDGFPSVGCTHCTQRVAGVNSPAQYSREGRWQGQGKMECGLHSSLPVTNDGNSRC